MSIFSKIFGSSDTEKPSPEFWNYINSEADLEKALEESHEKRVAIFKHSTRCFISKTVLNNFEKEVGESDKEASYYFLDLLANRNISNKIAENLDVEHQSPQLIVLENGKAVKNASHHSISVSLI